MTDTVGILALCALLALGLTSGRDKKPAQDPAALPDDVKVIHLVSRNWWETNMYILGGTTGQAMIIDAADELEAVEQDKYRPTGADTRDILKTLKDNKLTLKYIVLTHGHIDHIGAIAELKKQTGAELLMHAGDARDSFPKDTHMVVGGVPKVDRMLKDKELLTLDGMTLEILHTPGHSPGSICLRTTRQGKPVLFSGDTLFYHNIGRTNFRDGSGDETLLLRMIREKLFTLPDETIVFPGHYNFTTIGEEKKNNPFLNPLPPNAVPPIGEAH